MRVPATGLLSCRLPDETGAENRGRPHRVSGFPSSDTESNHPPADKQRRANRHPCPSVPRADGSRFANRSADGQAGTNCFRQPEKGLAQRLTSSGLTKATPQAPSPHIPDMPESSTMPSRPPQGTWHSRGTGPNAGHTPLVAKLRLPSTTWQDRSLIA